VKNNYDELLAKAKLADERQRERKRCPLVSGSPRVCDRGRNIRRPLGTGRCAASTASWPLDLGGSKSNGPAVR
jgi:hypothetical protein